MAGIRFVRSVAYAQGPSCTPVVPSGPGAERIVRVSDKSRALRVGWCPRGRGGPENHRRTLGLAPLDVCFYRAAHLTRCAEREIMEGRNLDPRGRTSNTDSGNHYDPIADA